MRFFAKTSLPALFLAPTFGAAPVFDVYNAASMIPAAVQNIAQGSRLVLRIPGTGIGPSKKVTAGYPLPTTAGLAGLTLQANVGGPQAYPCILVYAAFEEVGAILPSSVPLGRGQLTLYYTTANGTVMGGPNPQINVVPVSFGIYTQSGLSTGPAVVTDASGNAVDVTNPAHNGDTISLRGTGLGAITADETVPPPMVDLNSGAQVFLGDQPATVLYGGRAGGGPGNDRIDFVVPNGVSGCYVSLEVKVGGVVSNFASVPVTSADQTTCADSALGFSGADLQRNASGGLNIGAMDLTSLLGDQGDANFNRLNLSTLTSLPGPGVGVVTPSIGSCAVYADHGTAPLLPTVPAPGLDAGPQLNVKSNSDSRTIDLVSKGIYTAKLSRSGNGGGHAPVPPFLFPGVYTIDNAGGGADVGPFSASITIPQTIVWSNQPSQFATISRSQDLLITWTGGGPNDVAVVFGVSISGSVPDGLVGEFICSANASDGQLTVPADVMANIPSTDLPVTAVTAAVAVGSFSSARFTAEGLDLGYVWSLVTTAQTVVFQ